MAAHPIRFHMKFMVEFLYKHSSMGVAIPSFSNTTLCNATRTVCSSNQFCASVNNSVMRTRALCSDAIPTVTPAKRIVMQPNEETKQYLTLLGIDCDLLQNVKPTVLKEEVSKVKHHVKFLQSLNLSDAEILEILKKTPELLKVDVYGIQGHIKYLQDDLGLDGLLILNILQRVPKFFATPLSTIKENVCYVQTLNLTNQNMRILMKYSPSLFYRRRKGVQTTGEHLRRVMLEHDPQIVPERSLRYMLRCDPLMFGRTTKEIDDRLQHLITLGFSGVPLTKIIRYCPSVLRIGTSFITERLQLLQKRLSLSYEETLQMVARMPKVLHFSDETIVTKIDLVLKKGYTTADIVRSPRVFSRSLHSIESRLDRISELKHYRLKSLNILLRTDEYFEDFMEELRRREQVKEDELKIKSEE